MDLNADAPKMVPLTNYQRDLYIYMPMAFQKCCPECRQDWTFVRTEIRGTQCFQVTCTDCSQKTWAQGGWNAHSGEFDCKKDNIWARLWEQFVSAKTLQKAWIKAKANEDLEKPALKLA